MNVAVRTPTAQTRWRETGVERARRILANADARAIAGIGLLLAVLAALSWRKWGVPSVDAGHELTVAASIAGGGEPYLNVRYFYGPAGVYSLGAAFAVFGTSFTTAFAFGLVQAGAILGASYALARRLLGVLPAFLATAVIAGIGFSGTAYNFVLPHTNSATFGVLFILLMLLALSHERLILAGLAAGVVALTRPEFAVVAALAGGAFLVGRARERGVRAALRAIPPLALPALALAGSVLAVLAHDAGTSTLFTQNLWPVDFLRKTGFGSQRDWAPLDLESFVATAARAAIYLSLLAAVTATAVFVSRARDTAGRIRALWPLPGAIIVLLLADAAWRLLGPFANARTAVEYECTHLLIGMSWLPALGFAACLLVAIRLLRGESAPLSGSWAFDLALVVAASALGARAYDAFTAEGSYAPYYAAPLVLLLGILHQRVGERWPAARGASLGMLAAVAVGLVAYAQLALYPDDSVEVHTARGTFVTTPQAAPALQGTIDFIRSHTSPGEPILALPADAGLHFMTDRPPALYDVMFLPGLLDSVADERSAIRRLRAERVRYAIVSRRRFVGYGFPRFGVDYNRLLARTILKPQNLVATFGGGPAMAGTNPSRAYDVYRIRY